MHQDIYHSGEYWEKNESFHEEDALYKATNCHRLLKQHGLDTKPISVIDVGCGSGKFLFELSGMMNGKYLGVDVSTRSVETAQAKHQRENLTFERQDLADIKDKFDLVTMNDVFEHVDDYIGFLRDTRRVGEYFYFNIPLDMTTVSVLRHSYMILRESVGHIHYFSKKSALATLEYAGYEIVGHQYNNHVLHQMKTQPTIKSYLAVLPRLLTYQISPDFSVNFLGGASLGVLCRGKS